MREFHFQYAGFTFSGETIRFCGATVPLYIMGEDDRDTPSPRQLAMIGHIEALEDADLRDDTWSNAIAYCNRVDSKVGLRREGITIDYNNIGQHFRTVSLTIPELEEFAGNIFLVHYDCDWEPEHGMQLVIEDGKIVRCSSCDGLAFSGRHWLAYLKLTPEERTLRLQALPSS